MCFRSLEANGARVTPRERKSPPLSALEREQRQKEINEKKQSRRRSKLKKKKRVLSKPKQTAVQ